jgi:hypothetical protein
MTTTLSLFRSLLLVLLVPALGAAGTPQSVSSAGDSSRQFGMIFFVQTSPYVTSINSYADGGYTVSLGFGLNVTGRFQLALEVYTGREMIPPGSVKPVDGWLPLGGATLEATYFFTPGMGFRPYCAAGYGLFTINGGGGYNGGGGNLEAGLEWDFSRYFSIRGGAVYGIIRYHDPTGEASQAAGFEPFTQRFAGAALRCSFYPSVLP